MSKRSETTQDIAALAEMFEQRVEEGWSVFLLSFMFRPLGGCCNARLTLMRAEVERVYYRLQKRVVRYRRSSSTCVPIFIGAPDLTPGSAEKLIIEGEHHDGLHSHVATLIPPAPRYEKRDGTLAAHIEAQIAGYVPRGGILLRLHCQPFTQTYGNAVKYALKGLYRFGRDELIILPENYRNQRGNNGAGA